MTDAIDDHLRRIKQRHEQIAALRELADHLKVTAASLSHGGEHRASTKEQADTLRERLERWSLLVNVLAETTSAGRSPPYLRHVAPVLSEIQRSGLTRLDPLLSRIERAFAPES